MKRRLFNTGALISLVVCLTAIVFWVRSYWWEDTFGYSRISLDSSEGSISLIRTNWGHGGFFFDSEPVEEQDSLFNGLLHFNRYTIRTTIIGAPQIIQVWIFPHWCLVLVCAALPMARLVMDRRMSRTTRHACPACGYDLRGTPGSDCPECGADREAKA